MRLFLALGLAALLTTVFFAAGGEALAQLRLLPASEFQRIAVRIPQAVSRNLEAMQQSNDFEFLVKFRAKSRYRRIARPVGMLKLLMQDQTGKTGTSLCTASIISRDYILTNNHCVPGPVGTGFCWPKFRWRTWIAKIPARCGSTPWIQPPWRPTDPWITPSCASAETPAPFMEP